MWKRFCNWKLDVPHKVLVSFNGFHDFSETMKSIEAYQDFIWKLALESFGAGLGRVWGGMPGNGFCSRII